MKPHDECINNMSSTPCSVLLSQIVSEINHRYSTLSGSSNCRYRVASSVETRQETISPRWKNKRKNISYLQRIKEQRKSNKKETYVRGQLFNLQ